MNDQVSAKLLPSHLSRRAVSRAKRKPERFGKQRNGLTIWRATRTLFNRSDGLDADPSPLDKPSCEKFALRRKIRRSSPNSLFHAPRATVRRAASSSKL